MMEFQHLDNDQFQDLIRDFIWVYSFGVVFDRRVEDLIRF